MCIRARTHGPTTTTSHYIYSISTAAWDTSACVQTAGGTGPPGGMYEGPPTGLNLLQEGVAANWVTSVPSPGQTDDAAAQPE